jgi:hypothetical protein
MPSGSAMRFASVSFPHPAAAISKANTPCTASCSSIWRTVAEDYAPFDVDVTTEEPAVPVGGQNSSGSGIRVVIGGSSYDW